MNPYRLKNVFEYLTSNNQLLKKKLKPDGTIDKYKSRLVAKGFEQKENIVFFYTFSPLTRITSILVLILLASIHNLIMHQMDVKTAF